mgnify:FL=1
MDVYRFVMDVEDKDLKLQTEETDGYMFATLEQIRALPQRENSYIMTVLRRCLSSEQIPDWFSARI